MAEHCLEFCSRATAAAWNFMYASNRGNLSADVERLSKQLNDVNLIHAPCERNYTEAQKMIVDGRTILENSQKASVEMKQMKDQLTLDLEASKKTILEMTGKGCPSSGPY